MLKVLFCSPYLSSDDVVKGGINTWGRYIMSYSYDQKEDFQLLPVSFDRHVSLSSSKSIVHRVYNGIKEYQRPIQEAISLMKSKKPDVMHLCTSSGLGLYRDLILIKKASKFGIKSIIHLHFGRIPELSQSNNWEWKLLSKIIRLSDAVVVMNRPSEITLRNKGFLNIKYLPNPLGQDVLDKVNQMRDNYQRIPRRLLYAGHIIKTKGVYELVEATLNIPNIELRLVGKCFPKIEADLRRIASMKNESSWIKIVGEVDHESVLAELLQADLFVFPSYTEGFPNVILEAMACGCPIISTDVGAIPEMLNINEKACGICFAPKDIDAIVDAICATIENDSMKRSLADNAFNRLNSEYIMPKVWDRLVEIWKSL